MLATPASRRHALTYLSLTVLLSACGKSTTDGAPAHSGTGASSAETGSGGGSGSGGKVYTVGSDATNAPFESEDDKGDVIGFDAELLQAVAAKAGIEIELINTPWEGLLTALEQGDLDAAISSIVMSDDRRQALDFSAPYFDAQQIIIVPNTSAVSSLGDLKSLRVGVQNGASADDLLTPLFSRNPTLLQRFESIPLALTELEGKTLDAVVADNGVLMHYATHNGSHQYRLVHDAAFEVERYAIAVKKGNADLLGKFNQGLAAVRADGSFDKLHARYFGARGAAAAASR